MSRLSTDKGKLTAINKLAPCRAATKLWLRQYTAGVFSSRMVTDVETRSLCHNSVLISVRVLSNIQVAVGWVKVDHGRGPLWQSVCHQVHSGLR